MHRFFPKSTRAALAAALLTVTAGQAAAACSQRTLETIFGGLTASEYYSGSFARAKDRGVATHISTGEPTFFMRQAGRAQVLEATFDAQFTNRRDKTTLRLQKNGSAEIELNAWDGATFPVDLLHCEIRVISDPPATNAGAVSNDRILIVGRYAEGNGISAFTLALTEFDLPG
ncbi:MAG: hypothetical protein AAGF30_06760 [Pseudomonadota bacterium]